jgi:type IV secretory pathway protease TraF
MEQEAAMAAIAVILGGAAGFFSALIALILFNASWLVALGLWTMGGVAVALLLIAFALLPRRAARAMVAKHA